MAPLLFKKIKSEKQYYEYCHKLEELDFKKKKSKDDNDVIDLLLVLIEHYDMEHNTFEDLDPVDLLQYLMGQSKIKAVDMAKYLGISKSLMSDILNYRRGFSKPIIRKLAERFKVRQDAFNRSYKLAGAVGGRVKKAPKVKM